MVMIGGSARNVGMTARRARRDLLAAKCHWHENMSWHMKNNHYRAPFCRTFVALRTCSADDVSASRV